MSMDEHAGSAARATRSRSARRAAARLERRPLRPDAEVDSRQAERELVRDVRAERMLLVKAGAALALCAALIVVRFLFLV